MAAITLSYGRRGTDGIVDGEERDQAQAVATTEGDVYWPRVPLPPPTPDHPVLFIVLPDAYTLIDVIGFNAADWTEMWERDGETSSWHYESDVMQAPEYDNPWPVQVIARPGTPTDASGEPSVIVIGRNGYCDVEQVKIASGVYVDEDRTYIQFIQTGFKHINAQINVHSSKFKLVPPIEDQDIIDSLERLNIDFAAGRMLLSRNDESGSEFLSRFDRNLEKYMGRLSKQGTNIGPPRTVYTGEDFG